MISGYSLKGDKWEVFRRNIQQARIVSKERTESGSYDVGIMKLSRKEAIFIKSSLLFKVGTMPVTRLRVDRRYRVKKGNLIKVQVMGNPNWFNVMVDDIQENIIFVSNM